MVVTSNVQLSPGVQPGKLCNN